MIHVNDIITILTVLYLEKFNRIYTFENIVRIIVKYRLLQNKLYQLKLRLFECTNTKCSSWGSLTRPIQKAQVDAL